MPEWQSSLTELGNTTLRLPAESVQRPPYPDVTGTIQHGELCIALGYGDSPPIFKPLAMNILIYGAVFNLSRPTGALIWELRQLSPERGLRRRPTRAKHVEDRQ